MGKVPDDPFFVRYVGGTIGRSGDYWRPQAKRKQSEREYYETIIGSHLQHDPDRRLRSSANQHHLVTGDFKPGDNLDDDYQFSRQQFGDRDRLYPRIGDHARPWYGKAGPLRY